MTDSPEVLDGSVIMDEPSELPTAEIKKSRRQPAIYPNTLRAAPKPFSRSAAKRESVMALGSIEHLQHYFTKSGIASKQRPMIRTKGLVPAIGGRGGHVRAASSVTSIPELPPSPMVPTSSARLPFVRLPKTYEFDPAQLKPGVIKDLKAVEQAWRLGHSNPDDPLLLNPEGDKSPANAFDVLSALRTTTHAIRSVRDYVVSLPDDHITHSAKHLEPYRSPAFSAPGTKKDPTVQSNLTVQSLGSLMASVPAASVPLSPARKVSGERSVSGSSTPGSASPIRPRPSLPNLNASPNLGVSTFRFPSMPSKPEEPVKPPEEPLALVRRAALDVLIALRGLEERARVQGAEPDPSGTHSRGSTSNEPPPRQDTLSASSRSDTPADKTFHSHSGDEGDRDSATSYPTSSLHVTSRPKLHMPGPGGVSTETVLVHGRGAVQVWSDSDEEDFMSEEPEKREVWDERLVLGGGWLYSSDLTMDDMKEERSAVGRYLDVVDAVLFRGRGGGKRGWDRERRKGRASDSGTQTPANSSVMSDSEDEGAVGRRVSGALSEAMRYLSVVEDDTLHEEDEEGEEEEEGLPDWASVEPFGSDLIARTNALLRYLLPQTLIWHLPRSPTRDSLLNALSDGQMLCVAYNAGVRKSRKAWGFINAQSIHDIASASNEEKAAGSYTFRRRENLGLWAAALKLRYVIDIVPAEPKSTLPTRHFHQAPEQPEAVGQYAPNQFSPIVIAKHEPGWEDMLERALWEWVNAVVTERKQESG